MTKKDLTNHNIVMYKAHMAAKKSDGEIEPYLSELVFITWKLPKRLLENIKRVVNIIILFTVYSVQ